MSVLQPRENAEIRNEVGSISFHDVDARSIVGIGLTRKVNKKFNVKGGIGSIFDKTRHPENEGVPSITNPVEPIMMV